MVDQRLVIPEFWSFARARDGALVKTQEVRWQGPYAWPGHRKEGLPELPRVAGVYLQTLAYQDGYILRSVGVTNDTRRRMREHRKAYLEGRYTILDVDAASAGVRRERWHGWEEAKKNAAILAAHRETIREWANAQLEAYRLFVLVENEARLRERIESAILHSAYGSRRAWGDMIDGGMHSRGRFTREMPRVIRSACNARVYGLPETLEV